MSEPILYPLKGPLLIHDDHRVTNDTAGSVASRQSLTKKTAITTGAGAGIGYGIALAYAEMGCNLALWYNSNDAAVEKAKAISNQYGIQCTFSHDSDSDNL